MDNTSQLETDAQRRKLIAEATKAEAEAEKAIADAAKTRFEVEALQNAEARLSEAHQVNLQNNELNRQTALVEQSIKRIYLDREQRQERDVAALDRYHHVYRFEGEVDEDSVGLCIGILTNWMRTAPGESVDLILDSPGGAAIWGMHLWDFLTYLKSNGHHLTTIAWGMAASMAGILLQAGDTRVLGRESYLLIHEVSFWAGGKIGEVEDTQYFMKKMSSRMLDIYASRSAQCLIDRGDKPNDLERVTQAQKRLVERNWTRKDWWLDSRDAYNYGFVDEVR